MQVAPNTCVIVTGVDLVHVLEGNLWLSDLYLRLSRGTSSRYMISVRGPGQLWMTQIVVQGDGQGYTAVSTLDNAALLVDGAHLLLWLDW